MTDILDGDQHVTRAEVGPVFNELYENLQELLHRVNGIYVRLGWSRFVICDTCFNGIMQALDEEGNPKDETCPNEECGGLLFLPEEEE